eukprot:250757_1
MVFAVHWGLDGLEFIRVGAHQAIQNMLQRFDAKRLVESYDEGINYLSYDDDQYVGYDVAVSNPYVAGSDWDFGGQKSLGLGNVVGSYSQFPINLVAVFILLTCLIMMICGLLSVLCGVAGFIGRGAWKRNGCDDKREVSVH